jgi:GlpG protein
MRELATFPSADRARVLADHLLTLKIDTQLEQQPEGWTVWVRNEDHVPLARQELEVFQRDPDDPRFTSASGVANSLRKQKAEADKAFHRRQERFHARMGRAGTAGNYTLALIVLSVLVLIVKDGTRYSRWLVQALSIAPYEYVLVFDPSAGEQGVKVELRCPEGLQPILHGQVWRLVTPMFIHITIWHLFFNMWWLYVLGGAIEWRRGRYRYLALILSLSVASNLAQYFLGNLGEGESLASLPRSPNFGGMSGVVYGLLGYVWMKTRFQPEMGLRIDNTNIILMMVWLFLCMTPASHILIGSRVANVAHVAGLLMGMLIGYAPILWQSLRTE